jgi:hypothetical protein
LRPLSPVIAYSEIIRLEILTVIIRSCALSPILGFMTGLRVACVAGAAYVIDGGYTLW